jgi:hypothetical protein
VRKLSTAKGRPHYCAPQPEDDGTFTRHDNVSHAGAMSSAAGILLPRPLALLSCVRRRMSPRLLGPPSVSRSDQMATASEVDTPRYKNAVLV